jgi:hypothetical protein
VGAHVPTQSASVVQRIAMSFEQRRLASPWPVSQRAQSASVVQVVAMSFVQVFPGRMPYTSMRFVNAA